MARIFINGQEVEAREGVPVLQAALEMGLDVPYYCYHPALRVVASCRLCLMEMKMPHPKTGEMGWAPKLFPSCQTPVKDGLEVRFDSEPVIQNQKHCMEYFLLNHPLDCPICDQAGECYLQDYSFKFGSATSRMVDPKTVNPKKDIGPRTLLYQDRCVMCTRCVRFTEEISGTGELCVVSRGNRSEIDVFPGLPLDNPLQGNVVDICPVGSLLDKDFLFKQRVWHLHGAESICPGCSTGCAIHVDHNDGRVYRLKPRYNPGVNDWWMCDEGRFGWKYIDREDRIAFSIVRRAEDEEPLAWEALRDVMEYRFERKVEAKGVGSVAAVLSPMMACEEAWLLATFIRRIDPDAALVSGPVPAEGDDQAFPVGCRPENAKFTIRSEKCPNARGVRMVIDSFGGTIRAFDDFVAECGKGAYAAVWVVGGYPDEWIDAKTAAAIRKAELLVVQDMLPNPLTEAATILLPACAWTERSGSFVNHDGLIQPFEPAVAPIEGARRDGQYLFELAGFEGVYSGQRVRELMAESVEAFAQISEAAAVPARPH